MSGSQAPKNIPFIQVIWFFRRATPRGAQCKEFRKFLSYIPTGSRITPVFFNCMAFQTVNLYITTLTGQGFWAAHKLLTGQIIYAIAAGPDFFFSSSHLLHFLILLSGTCYHSYIAAGSNFLFLRFPFIPSYSYFASLHPENCMHEWLLNRAFLRGRQTALNSTPYLLFT